MKNNKNKISLITLPTGSGKTGIVLEGLLGLTKNTKIENVRSKLINTIILVPNKNTEKAWKEEIYKKLNSPPFEKQSAYSIKSGINPSDINNYLKDKKLEINFCRYRKNKSFLNEIKKAYGKKEIHIIIDEWHRLSTNRRNEIQKFNEKKPGLLKNIKKIFLVSATPFNPIFSEKKEEEDTSNDPFKHELNLKVKDLSKFIDSFIQGRANSSTYEHLITIKKNKKLKFPLPFPLSSTKKISIELSKDEKSNLKKFISNTDSNHSFRKEYSFFNNIFFNVKDQKNKVERLKASDFRLESVKTSSSKKSFNHIYVSGCNYHNYNLTYKNLTMKKILDNSFKIKYLISTLQQMKIIKGKNIYKVENKQEQENVIIFCKHTSVCLYLTYYLREMTGCFDSIKNSLSEHSTEKNKKIKKTDIYNKFNDPNSKIRILILTEKDSESINLHKRCRNIIHYELPWSPITLFQRVGRLTRIQNNDIPNEKLQVNVSHIIVPGSTEEEIVYRLIERINALEEVELPSTKSKYINLIPFFNNPGMYTKQKKTTPIEAFIGSGPSLILKSFLAKNKK